MKHKKVIWRERREKYEKEKRKLAPFVLVSN